MKKQYTKKQIQEAIAYWKNRLKEGNYRKVNESAEVAGTYRIIMTVDGNAVDAGTTLVNVDLGADDRTVCRFVRGDGIPEDFYENEDELYSRELYVFGGGIDVDGLDDENIPSTTEPSQFYETIEDFDNEANAKSCIPVIDYDDKTVMYDFR